MSFLLYFLLVWLIGFLARQQILRMSFLLFVWLIGFYLDSRLFTRSDHVLGGTSISILEQK